jgi:two-component system OmpR family response regulator
MPASPSTPRERHVLIVDDDPAIRELFRTVLRRAGFVARLADSGRTAMRMVADYQPDVVTLDLAMPGEDGFAVIDRLRALPNAPAVVVVSGAAYPDEALALGTPVVAVLTKPLHPEDLVAACHRALRRPHGGRGI